MSFTEQTWLSGKNFHLTARQEQSIPWWGAVEVSYPPGIMNQTGMRLTHSREQQSWRQYLPPWLKSLLCVGHCERAGRRWCYSVPTTALKGKHDFKDPLLYLTWHSSLEGAMAEWKIMVFMTKKHVVDAPSTLSLSLLPISSLKKRFKDLLFYCFDHVPRKENVLYAGTDVAILRWRSWGWKGPSHTEFQSGRAEIVFLTSSFCFDIVSDLHRSGKESLDTPGPVAPNVTAPSHSLYFPFLFFSLNHLRFSCRFNAPFASKYFCVYFLKTRTVSV